MYVIQGDKIEGSDRILVSFIKEDSLYGIINTINKTIVILSIRNNISLLFLAVFVMLIE